MKKFVTAALFEIGALSVRVSTEPGEFCCIAFSEPHFGGTQHEACLAKSPFTRRYASSSASMLTPDQVVPMQSYKCGSGVVAEFCYMNNITNQNSNGFGGHKIYECHYKAFATNEEGFGNEVDFKEEWPHAMLGEWKATIDEDTPAISGIVLTKASLLT